MQPIRVAVGEMPRLLRDIILSSLSPHADLEVVEAEPLGPPARDAVEVLLVGSEGAELEARHERLLRRRPRLRILAIDSGGREAAIYELRTHRVALNEVSTDSLADAIRAACAQPGAAGLVETGPAS